MLVPMEISVFKNSLVFANSQQFRVTLSLWLQLISLPLLFLNVTKTTLYPEDNPLSHE